MAKSKSAVLAAVSDGQLTTARIGRVPGYPPRSRSGRGAGEGGVWIKVASETDDRRDAPGWDLGSTELQPEAATTSAKTSAGVRQSRVRRGRPLSWRATASRCAW